MGPAVSLNRYAKRRDENEPEIIQALEAIGCTVESLDEPCDLLVGRGAVALLLEVKMPGGRKTVKQKKFAARWKGPYRIVTTADEAIEYVQKMTVLTAYP